MTPNETLIYRNGACWRGTPSGEPRRLKNIEGRGIPWLTTDEQGPPFTAKRGDSMSIAPMAKLVQALTKPIFTSNPDDL